MGTCRILGTILVAAVASVAVAAPAQAASTRADWRMNESAGASNMHDSSAYHKDGTIGSKVSSGASYGSGRGYRFTSPGSTTANRAHLVTVPHTSTHNPGSRSMHIIVEVATYDSGANLLQKGQAGTSGGFYKVEINSGRPACSFTGSIRQRLVTWHSSITDGRPHRIVCDKYSDRVRISVDGKSPVTAWNGVGSISNYKPVSIGGKYECNAGSVSCDYLTGTIGSARITFD